MAYIGPILRELQISQYDSNISARDTVHSSRVTPYIIYMCWSPTYYRRAVPSCPLRVRSNNSIDTMFSPAPAPSTAGSGYTRARTPQGGMSPTALSALFPTATTSEGLTATEVASQTNPNPNPNPTTSLPILSDLIYLSILPTQIDR